MILPSKHMQPDRALIAVGADILAVLPAASPVSEIWDRVRARRAARQNVSPITFDWFTLAMALLYALHAIEMDGDLVAPAKLAR